jgi:tuftelin-interacting protein 11
MLEKMGWKKGYGLGVGGAGIVEPIQAKLRPMKMGIGFNGFQEKTEQVIAEERRRSVEISSGEDDKENKQTSNSDSKEQPPNAVGREKSGGQGSKKRPKVCFVTAESGDVPIAQVRSQRILDLSGKTVRYTFPFLIVFTFRLEMAVGANRDAFARLRRYES